LEREKIYAIELKELRDLVCLVAFSPTPVLHHLPVGDKHLYFARATLRGESAITYYILTDQAVSGRYAIYNLLKGSIEFGDNVSTDSGLRHIPVLEVSSQNIIPQSLIDELLSRP